MKLVSVVVDLNQGSDSNEEINENIIIDVKNSNWGERD